MSYINRESFYEAMLKRFGCVPALTDYSSSLRNDIHLDEALNLISAADVVEVVRCKNCKHFLQQYDVQTGQKLYYGVCKLNSDRFCDEEVNRDHYCGYGIKQTDLNQIFMR